MWWIKKHLAHLLLAYEHAKGDASAKGSLASRFVRACSQANPLLLAQNDWPNCPLPRHEADTKPCRRTSAWQAIRTDALSKSILLRPWPRLFKRWIALSTR